MRIFKNSLKSGHKEFYVTFGQQYSGWYEHPFAPWAHKDGYLVIEAENLTHATLCAHDHLGKFWSMIYPADRHSKSEWLAVFPRGELARIVA